MTEMTRPKGETTFARLCGIGALGLGLGLALQALYTTYWGVWEPRYHRPLAVLACIAIVILSMPLVKSAGARSRFPASLLWAVDAAMLAVSAAAVLRFIDNIEDIDNLVAEYSAVDLLIALGVLLVLIDLTRRLFGIALAAVALAALAYAVFGADLPWVFRHSGFSMEQVMEIVWYGFQGVFGFPTAIVLSLILIYIIFGSVLESTGAANSLVRVAFALAGGWRGGPAHAAVAASAAFGTMSGSVAANVVGTGAFTIPLIKRRGFSPVFAGAVEAAASTGGQIVPPVMGVAAFVMAELTGVPYLTICAAALLPAVFYYGSLFLAVRFQARRMRIRALDRSEYPRLNRRDLANTFLFLGPILVILFVLALGRTPQMAGFWAILAAILLGFLINPDLRRNPFRVAQGLARGGVAGAGIVMAVGAIGIILAVVELTGIGLKFAGAVVDSGGTNLVLTLLVTGASALVLGMGMPTLPAYLIIILVMGPAIAKLGVPVLAIHMFVFYYGVLSSVTPPVALGAFAAAPIAGTSPMRTAVAAMGLSLPGFLIPFVFVMEPSLLLVLGVDIESLIWVMLRLSFSIWLLATAVVGFEIDDLPWFERGARLLAAIVVLGADWQVQAFGLVLGAAFLIVHRLRARGEQKAAVPEATLAVED